MGKAGGSGGAGLESSIVGIVGRLVGIAVPVSVGRAVRRGVGVSVAGGRICENDNKLQARLMPIKKRPINIFGYRDLLIPAFLGVVPEFRDVCII